jgi:hypothetical protein
LEVGRLDDLVPGLFVIERHDLDHHLSRVGGRAAIEIGRDLGRRL